MTPQDRIRQHYLARHAHIGEAFDAMSAELVEVYNALFNAEAALEREERKVSAGYVRRAPSHRSRQPKSQPDAITDDWITTGRDHGG